MSPSTEDADIEISLYKDLLLLKDLPKLTEEGITDRMIQAAPTLSRPGKITQSNP